MDYALAKRKPTGRPTPHTEQVDQHDQDGELLVDRHFCKLSIEARCLSAATLARIRGVAKGAKIKDKCSSDARKASMDRLLKVGFYRAGIRLAGDTTLRYMVKVRFPNDQAVYFGDIVTGTLYQENGQCLTSSNLTLSAPPVPGTRRSAERFLASRCSMEVAEC